MATIPNPAKSRTWDLGTSANGTFFDTEFNQLYANDNDLDGRVQALELISIPIITAPVAWVPTFTGFGTVSGVTAYSWRVGSCLFFEIHFTSGTSTATEARISLGYNGTNGNVTTASTYPTLQAVGYGGSDTGTSPFVMLAEASKTYLTIGVQDGSSGTRAGISKRNGDALLASGWVFSVSGSVRITGW